MRYEGDTPIYYHANSLGSVVALTDEDGELLETVEYDVYGASAVTQHNGASPTGNRFLFTGREQDAETGLYHYRARAYDPYLGRFLQCGINPLTAKEINGKKISTATSPPTSITITESSTLVLEK